MSTLVLLRVTQKIVYICSMLFSLTRYVAYETQASNAMCQINEEADFRNPNVPKVVTQKDGCLLYMSRAPMPTNKKLEFKKAMKQRGTSGQDDAEVSRGPAVTTPDLNASFRGRWMPARRLFGAAGCIAIGPIRMRWRAARRGAPTRIS